MLAAILHLGNVRFDVAVNLTDTAALSALNNVCQLLQIDAGALTTWLCTKEIRAVHEIVHTQLTQQQVFFAANSCEKRFF